MVKIQNIVSKCTLNSVFLHSRRQKWGPQAVPMVITNPQVNQMDLRAIADTVDFKNDPKRSSHFQAKPNKKTEFEL